MRERWSTVILQRTKQRIRIDLIARAIQQPVGIIAADVISTRGDGPTNIPRRIRIEDCILDFHCSTADAAASSSRVAAHGAVRNGQTGRDDAAAGGDPAAVAIIGVAYGVPADRAIDDGQT